MGSRNLGFALALVASSVCADVPDTQRSEVDYLLKQVAESACQFNRNGSWYPGAEAVEHIRNKYEHFRDRIHSTEEFIAFSATKSLMTGREYQVRCSGKEAMATEQWLRELLERYRGEKSP